MVKLERYRRESPLSWAPGVFPAMELLKRRPGAVRRLILHSAGARNSGVEQLVAGCEGLGLSPETRDRDVERLSGKENCYALLVFEKYEEPLTAGNHLLLHEPGDVGNMGTILRSALGFGVENVGILGAGVDPFDPRTVRASMGAVFSLHIAHYAGWAEYRALWPEHALYPFMLDGRATLEEAVGALQSPWALLFGNEARGLPPECQTLGTSVVIPHSDRIDSLNLGVAVSIALYRTTTANAEEEGGHE